uniref:Helicase HerA central domain-containing protein n=1 Tax=viral metagenome TaxID=1070528 RepID=A0A6M3M340_9ZZZZ
MISENPVGRVLESTMENARCEFDSTVKEGDALFFIVNKEEIRCRVDFMEVKPSRGLEGWISFRERPSRPPKALTILYRYKELITGIMELGKDFRGNDVKIDVNPLFNHTLNIGMSQRGKTHLMILLAEECSKRGIPAIVIDTQGEFIHMPERFKNVIVVDNITTANLIAHLQQKHIVIINLLGMGNAYKANTAVGILGPFYEAKEKDYADNENNWLLLEIPPTLIMVDEADVFAPKEGVRGKDFQKSAEVLEEIAKRGAKIGLGLVVATQRISRLAIDIRDNCNSVFCFRIIGRSNKMTLRDMHYFNPGVIKKIQSFTKGECIMLGEIGNQTIRTRDIITRRSKNVNFEQILGLDTDIQEQTPGIVMTEAGAIVDQDFDKVLKSARDRRQEEDETLFEDSDDGVVLYSDPLSDEELKKRLKEWEKDGNEKQ